MSWGGGVRSSAFNKGDFLIEHLESLRAVAASKYKGGAVLQQLRELAEADGSTQGVGVMHDALLSGICLPIFRAVAMGKKRDSDTDRKVVRMLHYFIRRVTLVWRLNAVKTRQRGEGQATIWDELWKILVAELRHKHAPRAFASLRTLTFAYMDEEARKTHVERALAERMTWVNAGKKRSKYADFMSAAKESAMFHIHGGIDPPLLESINVALNGSNVDAARYAAIRLARIVHREPEVATQRTWMSKHCAADTTVYVQMLEVYAAGCRSTRRMSEKYLSELMSACSRGDNWRVRLYAARTLFSLPWGVLSTSKNVIDVGLGVVKEACTSINSEGASTLLVHATLRTAASAGRCFAKSRLELRKHVSLETLQDVFAVVESAVGGDSDAMRCRGVIAAIWLVSPSGTTDAGSEDPTAKYCREWLDQLLEESAPLPELLAHDILENLELRVACTPRLVAVSLNWLASPLAASTDDAATVLRMWDAALGIDPAAVVSTVLGIIDGKHPMSNPICKPVHLAAYGSRKTGHRHFMRLRRTAIKYLGTLCKRGFINDGMTLSVLSRLHQIQLVEDWHTREAAAHALQIIGE